MLDQCRQLARYPFVETDYRLKDADGRDIEHLMIDEYVYSFWIDHAAKCVLVTEIEKTEAG